MPILFNDDPEGAMLEFAELSFDRAGPREWEEWRQANSSAYPQPIGGPPAMTKGYFSEIVLFGVRGDEQHSQRHVVEKAWRRLESEHLLETWSGDGNPDSTYRVPSELGRQLLAEDAHREYLGGLIETVRRKRSSVVKIFARDGQGIGSGFVIDGGRVVTAAHVVDLVGPEFVIACEDGTELAYRAVRKDSELDLAVLDLVGDGGLAPVRLGRDPALLDEVVVLGYPPLPQTRDAFLVANRGEVTALPADYHGRPVLVVSCLLRGGNSGGPVFDRRGQVVGVVSRRLLGDGGEGPGALLEGLGYAAAVPVRLVREFLAQ